MRKIQRRIAALTAASMLAIGLLGATAPAAAAAYTCPSASLSDEVGTGNTYVLAYESANFLAGPPWADAGVLCLKATSTGGLLVPNLKNVSYTNINDLNSPPRCAGSLFTSWGTWNDCISSIKVSIDCHHAVSFYSDANYGSLIASYSVSATTPTLPPGRDEAISSAKITYKSICSSSAPQRAEFTINLR